MVLGLLPGWHCVPKEKWHSQIWRRTYKVEGYMEGLRGAQQGRGVYGYRETMAQVLKDRVTRQLGWHAVERYCSLG